MRARSLGGIVAVLSAVSCTTGPRYTLNGVWFVRDGVDTAGLVLTQKGDTIVGYDLPALDSGRMNWDSIVVCGHVTGSHVQLYLPPDSNATFEGAFQNDSTVDGTLTSEGSQTSATLEDTPGKYVPYNALPLDSTAGPGVCR